MSHPAPWPGTRPAGFGPPSTRTHLVLIGGRVAVAVAVVALAWPVIHARVDVVDPDLVQITAPFAAGSFVVACAVLLLAQVIAVRALLSQLRRIDRLDQVAFLDGARRIGWSAVLALGPIVFGGQYLVVALGAAAAGITVAGITVAGTIGSAALVLVSLWLDHRHAAWSVRHLPAHPYAVQVLQPPGGRRFRSNHTGLVVLCLLLGVVAAVLLVATLAAVATGASRAGSVLAGTVQTIAAAAPVALAAALVVSIRRVRAASIPGTDGVDIARLRAAGNAHRAVDVLLPVTGVLAVGALLVDPDGLVLALARSATVVLLAQVAALHLAGPLVFFFGYLRVPPRGRRR